MKLIVQIPCFNEEQSLPRTVADIPRQIPGIDSVEVLVIDDGSQDRTVEVARSIGVEHIVRHRTNRGLARTFRTGLDVTLRLGADIIVNTDGDNQYAGADIAKLIQPIVEGRADIVVGDRETHNIEHFSATKKSLQKIGSFAVWRLSGLDIPDAVSGFRAFSREAALQLNIVSSFSYTIETLIQAGHKGLAVQAVPVDTNKTHRESRLFRNLPHFLERSATTMVRMYAMYKPLRTFLYLGTALTLMGSIPIIRFLYFVMIGQGGGHVQSLVLGGIFVVIGYLTFVIGLVADLIGSNRQLLEMTLEKVRRLELALQERGDERREADRPGE